MNQHYKSDRESNGDKGIGLGSSDPTPALPKREGVRSETNVLIIAKEADSFPSGEGRDGVNESVTSSEPDSLPIGEGWGRVKNPVNPTNDTSGQKPGYITANPYTYPIIKDYRKELKDHQSEAEYVLWEYLRNKKTGHKIRRQHVIDDFIADFVCLSKKVIIEIDGKIHKFQKGQDELRTTRLNKLGYEVIRFTNAEALNSPYQVAQKIKTYLNNRQNSTSLDPT